jgi:hypothetical protein
MSDTTTPGAAPSGAGSALSLPQAVQMLAERRAAREATSTPAPAEAEHEPASRVTMPYSEGTEADGQESLNVPPSHAEQAPAAHEPAAPPAPDAPTADAQSAEDAASIVVDGVALSADEVRRGYMRHADYSRKTQALAETSKSLDVERNLKLARLDQLIGALESQHPQEPNWVEIARKDPLGWVQQKVQWDNRRTALESAQRISAAMDADIEAREKRVMVADLAATDFPHWQDPRTVAHDLRDLAAYAQSQGYSSEEFNSITEARDVRLLDKARRWDDLQRNKPLIAKRLAIKPQVQRPGAKPTVAAHQRSLSSAWERFLKNPTVENGAAYQRTKRDASNARRSFE